VLEHAERVCVRMVYMCVASADRVFGCVARFRVKGREVRLLSAMLSVKSAEGITSTVTCSVHDLVDWCCHDFFEIKLSILYLVNFAHQHTARGRGEGRS
jgi:hypothetical protein